MGKLLISALVASSAIVTFHPNLQSACKAKLEGKVDMYFIPEICDGAIKGAYPSSLLDLIGTAQEKIQYAINAAQNSRYFSWSTATLQKHLVERISARGMAYIQKADYEEDPRQLLQVKDHYILTSLASILDHIEQNQATFHALVKSKKESGGHFDAAFSFHEEPNIALNQFTNFQRPEVYSYIRKTASLHTHPTSDKEDPNLYCGPSEGDLISFQGRHKNNPYHIGLVATDMRIGFNIDAYFRSESKIMVIDLGVFKK